MYRSDVENGRIWVSTDMGKTWTSVKVPFADRVTSGGSLILISDPYIPDRLFASIDADTAPFLYYSNDGGVSWNESTTPEQLGSANLFFSRAEKNIIYAVSGWGLMHSRDGGLSWSSCQNPEYDFIQNAQMMAVDPRNAKKVYFSTFGKGILLSEDGCQSWKQISPALNSLFVNVIELDPQNPDIIYAGTDSGAYVSLDAGATWGQVNDGLLGATVVYSIAVDKDGNVYAATPYGIFKLESR